MSASILPILLLFDIAIHWAQPPLNLFVRTYMQISLEINLFSGRNVRFAVAKLNKSSLGRLGKAQKKKKKKRNWIFDSLLLRIHWGREAFIIANYIHLFNWLVIKMILYTR